MLCHKHYPNQNCSIIQKQDDCNIKTVNVSSWNYHLKNRFAFFNCHYRLNNIYQNPCFQISCRNVQKEIISQQSVLSCSMSTNICIPLRHCEVNMYTCTLHENWNNLIFAHIWNILHAYYMWIILVQLRRTCNL